MIARLLLFMLWLSALSCSSTLIEHPGLRARFIWEDTGAPIAHTEVMLAHVGLNYTASNETDESGKVLFKPTFTKGYSGYPTSPVGLQLAWTLKVCGRHQPSGGYLFVNNTDIDHAIIDVGTIRVNPIFRAD